MQGVVGKMHRSNANRPSLFVEGRLKATILDWASSDASQKVPDGVPKPFFQCACVVDLLRQMHLNARFAAGGPPPNFPAVEVMKHPEIEADLARFDAHLANIFLEAINVAA